MMLRSSATATTTASALHFCTLETQRQLRDVVGSSSPELNEDCSAISLGYCFGGLRTVRSEQNCCQRLLPRGGNWSTGLRGGGLGQCILDRETKIQEIITAKSEKNLFRCILSQPLKQFRDVKITCCFFLFGKLNNCMWKVGFCCSVFPPSAS